MKLRKLLKILLIVLVVGFLLIQIVPFGRAHQNPAVVSEPNWDSPQTRELAQRACFDCHSNESVWPWYSNVAPMSWLVQNHVNEGRGILNFSDLVNSGEVDELGEVVREGEMPLASYLMLHPDAKLSDAERQALAAGLEQTAAQSPATIGGERGEHGERGEGEEHE